MIYNKYIGWGIPSPKALETICEAYITHCKKYPDAKLIDYGAGSGAYSLLLNDMLLQKGIQSDGKSDVSHNKVVAVDLPVNLYKIQSEFYPIVKDTNYRVDPNDVMLVVWGSDCPSQCLAVARYIEDGGKCLIIQGEGSGGMHVSNRLCG